MRKLLALIMAVPFLSSCNKDDNAIPKVSYLPLEVGNYWVYQEFRIDTSGSEKTANSIIDSVIIDRDTIINHKKYFVFAGTFHPFTYIDNIIDIVRDSSGYIVNQNGTVLFAENNFTDTIAHYAIKNIYNGDTLVTATFQMEKINNAITVPAGTFEVLDYKGTILTSMNTPGIKYPRHTNYYYAKGIGKIMHTYFYIQSPAIYEKRLLRYYVKE